MGLFTWLKGSLLGAEVLTDVYHRLGKRHAFRETHFVDPKIKDYSERWDKMAHVVIADDSDDHRQKTGYMSYDRARVMDINNHAWVLARGTKTGNYPGDEYDSDLLALKLDQTDIADNQLPDFLKRLIKSTNSSKLFYNSLVVAGRDGVLYFPRTFSIGRELEKLVGERVNNVVAKKAVRDGRYLSSGTLHPIVTTAMRYKPQVVEIITEGIEEILSR